MAWRLRRNNFSLSGNANATDAQRGTYSASAAAEGQTVIPYYYPQILHGVGSASVNGATSSSFLRASLELSSNTQDFQMAGSSQADWQEIIRVSGAAPSVIYLTVGVDVTSTGGGVIELNMGEISGHFSALTDIQYFPPWIDQTDFHAAFGAITQSNLGLVWPNFWNSYSFLKDPSSPNLIRFHGEHTIALNKTTGVAGADGYAYWMDFRVRGSVAAGDLTIDGSNGASILSITDASGNDLKDRVTFDSGMQFAAPAAPVSEPASLAFWSLGVFGLPLLRVWRRRAPLSESSKLR